MPVRNPGNDGRLLKLQYDRLREAIDGYYSEKKEQVLNVATTIRVLIHDNPSGGSRSLLSRLDADYWSLTIYDKFPPSPNAVLTLRTSMVMTGGGKTRAIRPTFNASLYHLVPLKEWWTSDYQKFGGQWVSKSTIIRTVADKDGGTHVDGIRFLICTHCCLSLQFDTERRTKARCHSSSLT